MFSITEAIKKEYIPAEEIQTSTKQRLSIHLKFLQVFFKTFLLIVDEILKKIIEIFKAPNYENISAKLVLVTGGGNGLGKELCIRFAEEGCDIAVVDIDIKNATKVVKEINEKYSVDAKAFQCDVSSYDAILKLKTEIENQMKKVDILVNNAGLLYMSNFLTSVTSDIKKVVDVNLTSQFWMVHVFLPSMIERKFGKIVSICSAVTLNPLPTSVIYTATKYGIKGFMDTLYDELCVNDYDNFVTLTTIHPDFINTRKDLLDVLERVKHVPLILTPKRVADETVKAVMLKKRDVKITDHYFNYFLINTCLPDRIRKEIKTTISDIKSVLNH